MGAVLRGSSLDSIDFYPVFSPKTHALLSIAPAEEDNAIVRKSSIRASTDDSTKEAIQDMRSRGFKSLFLVMGMQWCGLDDIEDLPDVPRQMFELRPDNRHTQSAALSSIPGFYPVFAVVPDIKAFETPATWEDSVHSAVNHEKVRKSPLVSVICGSKDMGKSTFARYLVNRLLNKHKHVAFLETDVGQSEFTPPGMIALHIIESPVMGPPYTHQHLTPTHSHFIGALTSASNPHYYLDTVGHLIRLYKERYDNLIEVNNTDLVPLVINTQGWINGLGYDLLMSIIQQTSPTDVFVMHSPSIDAPRNLPATFAADITPPPEQGHAPSIHYTQSIITPSAIRLDAHSSRALASVSYFHQDLHHYGIIGKRWWNFQARIVDRLPWVLDWRKGLQDGVWFLFDDVPKGQLLYALNGTLNPPPMPATTACYGLAIIRAIDPSNHAFHIITPLPSTQLKKVTAIVKGNLALPVAALLDQHNGNGNGIARQPWSKVPYVESSTNVNGIGASARKSRRINIRKRGP
ncbi:hypothetical protein BJV82DRAFT_516307 [Fennellomyces sp. T-0311]|nr:hypothetical protein BJV82DRAFT_516307 [Fennellomyces sp. T-0311]